MFVSHHHSVHHHTSGSHPSTHSALDQNKALPSVVPSTKSFAPRPTALSNSKQFIAQPGSFRVGTGKAAAPQQAHQTQHATTATTFAPRPFHGVPGVAPASQSRFVSQHQAQNGALSNRAPTGNFATTNPTIFASNNNNNTTNTGAINKNSPAVKFLFKKPQLPATLSSSAALYHFSSHNQSSLQQHSGQPSGNNTTGSGLSKFSIPKVNANGVNGVVSGGIPNGNLNGLPTAGNKPFAASASLLDQQNGRVSFLNTTNNRQNTGIAVVPSHCQPLPQQTHVSNHQLAFAKYQQNEQRYGTQSKSKGASNTKNSTKSSTSSAFIGSKEALYSQHNESKSSSKASSGPGLPGGFASNSVRSQQAQQAQLSAKSEHSSKHSKVFSSSTASQPGNNSNSRPSSGASFTKESKESSSKEKLSFSASHAKKESASVKSTTSSRAESANKKSSQEKKKSKPTKTFDATDCSELSPLAADLSNAKDDSGKKSKSKKESRDRSNSKSHSSKVKVDNEENSSSKKHKSKSKDKDKSNKKERKRKKDPNSSDESDDSEGSDEAGQRHEMFAKSKTKRRRHNSNSSTSSLAGPSPDSAKASPDEAYLYHPQAAASIAKGAMPTDAGRLYPNKDTHSSVSAAERTKQKLLAESVGGHFPALLHNSKLTQSPSTLFSAASFTATTSAHSPSPLASPPLSVSPSPSQKLISSKTSHLHEDSNGGLISKKESSSSSKKLSKISKDVLNNSSGTETSHLMSTKIKYRDDNSVTTIEIKSINKEKTWDNSNEIKKHKTTKESSKSSSSSKVLAPGSTKQSQTSSKANSKGEPPNSMQDSSKLSASNSSLSSIASNPTKKVKKSSSGDSKKQSEGLKESSSKKSKKSKAEHDDSSRKKKRDHSPSPLVSFDQKMPPPPTYPTTAHSKLGDSMIYGDSAQILAKAQFSKLDRHRSESPALSACSSSSEVSPYQPMASSVSKKQKSSAEVQSHQRPVASAKGHSRQQHQRKVKPDSDCDNEDDDDDDKMSTVSSMSVSSVSSSASSSSSMSISSAASSRSASSASSAEKDHSKSAKKTTVSKEYSAKDHRQHHSKSSVKQKEHRSKSKVQTNQEPFEFSQRAYSKYDTETGSKPSKPSKTKHAKEVPVLSSDDNSGSDSDSDSGSDSEDDEKCRRQGYNSDHEQKPKPPKVILAHSSDSESDQDNGLVVQGLKNAFPYPSAVPSPVLTKSSKQSFRFKDDIKRKDMKNGTIQQGQSLLAPVIDQKKPYSPVSAKNKSNNATILHHQNRKHSPVKRTSGGYTGLSDSDSSMDEADDHKVIKKSPPLAVEELSVRNDSRKKHKATKKKHSSKHNSDSDSSSASSSEESDSSSDENESDKDQKSDIRPRVDRQPFASPQTTPNSRLPPNNIYSRTNHHAPSNLSGHSSPFERLYQNISSGYGTERNSSSLSPPLSSTAINSLSFSELRELHCKIANLADGDLLQRVVDLVEMRNSRCFNIVNNCLQFDLVKLDHATILEIKRIIC